MPDLFVLPPEKSLRTRKPLEQPLVHAPEQPQIPLQPPAQPRILTPVKESSSTQDEDSIEKKNAAMPIFTSFWQNPRNLYFDTQEADEHILLFLRRHFITNAGWILFSSFLFFLPLGFFFLLSIAHYTFTFLSMGLIQGIILLYYVFVFTNAFVHFLDWYYNITVITTKRILDIQLKDLVSKKIAATKLSLIQDVDLKQIGTIPSLFHYGDVITQTAGENINFVAESVPNPEFVVQIVEELIGKKKEEQT